MADGEYWHPDVRRRESDEHWATRSAHYLQRFLDSV